MTTWVHAGKTIGAEGTTILYRPAGRAKPVEIESRRRHIPHANRVGTWDHTTYWVLLESKDVKEFYSLKAAKAYAETLL